jgi:NDP-sugar pyrophosphorylase family protein
MKAMILAAGLGTRMKPWTDSHPKAMVKVNGKTLLERAVHYLQRAGIYDVIVNVHHFAAQILEAIEIHKGWGSNISVSDERELLLETGGGLKKAAWYFQEEEHFVLINVDILTDLDLVQMINFHEANGPLATIATTLRPTSRYFLFNTSGELCGWRNVETGAEKIARTADELDQKAFSGIHVLSRRIFQWLPEQERFSMVDVYLGAAKTQRILSFDHSGGMLVDVGRPSSIAEAETLFP